MKITAETTIAKPPEEVFPWIAEPENARKWQPGVKETEILAATPDRIGTTFRETVEEDGGALDMEGTITEFVPDRLIGFQIRSRVHDFAVRYRVEAEGRNTKVSIEADIRWKFPMNLVVLFAGRKMEAELRKQMQEELSGLKNYCEAPS